MLWEIVVEWLSGAWCWLTDFERGTLAGWVSGVGSFAAAGTALWVACSARQVKVEASCDMRKSLFGDLGGQWIAVSATNTGIRSVTITGMAIVIVQRQFAKRRKNIGVPLLPDTSDTSSSTLPVTLLPDSPPAQWRYLPDVSLIVEELKRCGKGVKSLRCAIGKPHGKVIMIELGQGLIDAITKELNDKT